MSIHTRSGMDYSSFLKATAYIEEYQKRQMIQENNSSPSTSNFPSNTDINQLMANVREFMAEQRKLNEKVEHFLTTQQAINTLVLDKMTKCKCIGMDAIPDHLRSNFTTGTFCDMPPVPVFNLTIPPNYQNDAPSSQIDVELLKMHQLIEQKDSSDSVKVEVEEKPTTSNFDNTVSDLLIGNDMKWNRSKKSYKCSECDKVFREKHGLKQHQLIHDSSGAFFCDICGKRYTRQESVNRHKRTSQCHKNVVMNDSNSMASSSHPMTMIFNSNSSQNFQM
ncbi:unnamed protein product [Caenorhabditis bovis]|uniref:C2H2-type domain-containing protein n=1 Tax=Caenorhabditis bovis TaxID=2654633 RepID=A0A8S1F4M2_9PELO|nr:unnamed protein product [Caenorhabditis bovis]